MRVPDICLRDFAPEAGMLAMAAGDFVEVYGRPGQAGRLIPLNPKP